MIEKYMFPAFMFMAQAIVLLVGLLKAKKDRGQYRYNPHAPGEAQACKDHKAALAKLGEKMELQGQAIARVEENQQGQEKRLDWIQGKLNGKQNK
jgi:hypothetical protein